MEYIFILGRASELCKKELEVVLDSRNVSYKLLFYSQEIFHIKTEKKLDFKNLINLLGGVVKIAEVIGELTEPFNEKDFLDKVISVIEKEKKDFGLSFYGKKFCLNELIHCHKIVKEKLQEKEVKLGYVLPHKGLSLSSVVVAKKKLLEINIIEEKGKIVLARTLIVFDFEAWNKRDYGRPYVDPKKGMLPPKVARMMVNLGIFSSRSLVLGPKLLLDPFCGMGTILAEAMKVGCNVIGSDIDKESVEKTKKNLEWLVNQFKILSFGFSQGKNLKFKIFQSDAVHLSEEIEPESIDVIVTEPYLGPLVETTDLGLKTKNNKKITPEYLKNIITGLEKLYIGCLKDWYKILKSQGVIVIVFPSFNIPGNLQSVKKPIDICEKMGYNLFAGPYKYSRPQAIVERNIYILKKLKN